MSELDFIQSFLRDNRDYVLEKYMGKTALTVTSKSSATDLLTEVDLTIQQRFVEQVRRDYPGDVIVGEEGEYARLPEDEEARAWVIDPVDGTYNFVRGIFPEFGISIAFVKSGIAQAGGVLLPEPDLTMLAERGAGSFRNGEKLRVSEVQRLSEACVDIDSGGIEGRKTLLKKAQDALLGAGVLRCRGSAVVSICQIATADTEGYLHMRLQPWDFAAAQLIVEEAGGMASRPDGTPLRLFDRMRGAVVISNGAIHQELLDGIKR